MRAAAHRPGRPARARVRRRRGPAERDDGLGEQRHPDAARRSRAPSTPQGHGDDLPLRVRDVVELRPADRRGRRRLGHRRGRRVGRPQRADERHHLPLPRRGDQRGRRRARRGPHAEDRRRARAAGRETGSARNVTAVAARLAASVDPNGRATTYHFEYGTSTSYGKRTADASAGSGQSARSVSAAISGLTRQHALPLPRRGQQRRGRRPRARPQLRHAAQPAGHHRLRLAQPRGVERLDHRQRAGQRAGRRRRDRGPGAPGLPLRRAVLPGRDQAAAEQRLVLLQGRPAVGDGPPARDHAHDDRRRQPDRRGPQRAARRPARRGASPAGGCACRARSAPRCPTAAPRCRSARPAGAGSRCAAPACIR